MKYLNVFESFNESNYKQISLREYRESIYGEDQKAHRRLETFTKGEFDKIDEMFKSKYKWKKPNTMIRYFHESVSETTNTLVIIQVFKLFDEWFFVDVTIETDINTRPVEIYYKCDQFDGLLDCLKKIKKIQNEQSEAAAVKII